MEIDKEIIAKAAASPRKEDKTLAFSKIEGRHGTYALIDKGENRDREIRKPRPSIRAQLKADTEQNRDMLSVLRVVTAIWQEHRASIPTLSRCWH